MGKFRKASKSDTEISTSSLPDIVFLLLFFFMMSATINNNEDQVTAQIPQARSLTKIEKKELIREIVIGIPKDQSFGTEPVISTNSRIIQLDEVIQWAVEEKNTLPEVYKDQMIVIIRADELVPMGLVQDVQQKLRKANARKILFRTMEKV